MSAKISSVYRQSKQGRRNEPGSAKKKAGPPVWDTAEQERENEEAEILRQLQVFDLTSKWGPCAGITRLERWERAEKLGLKPPQAIKDVIEAAEGERREQLNNGIWENRGI